MSIARSLLLAAVTLAFAVPSAAQFSPIPGSGCPSGMPITTSGTPQIGMAISYQWFCSTRSDVPFMVFGPAVPPVFMLPQPPACGGNCFLIFPVPPIVLSGPAGRGLTVPVNIPQDPTLIGQILHTQGGCVTTAACIYLGIGTATKIQ
jgi:hypothetical protein